MNGKRREAPWGRGPEAERSRCRFGVQEMEERIYGKLFESGKQGILGYLAYDADFKGAYIPNYEISKAFLSALEIEIPYSE